MKKKFVSAMMAAMMLVLAGCGNGSTETDVDKAPVQTEEAVAGSQEEAATEKINEERTTLTVGFDAGFPPYGYMDDNGEYVGFDLDLAQEVCNRNGWELIKQPIDWAAKDMELSSGTIDCIWNGFTINGRENDYTWSVPYVNNKQVIVVRADSDIKDQAGLAGKIVGVQQDSSALAALEEAPGADLAATFAGMEQYADYNTAFMDLEAGAIDALAVDIGVASYQIASRGEGFTILEQELASEQYGIGFLLGNEALKDAVEGTLMEMVEDGTFAEIVDKYSDYGMSGLVCLE
ncbi:MAG: amino acid ABC transporter substrate-binding protein [Lachnospiraceae bacterium]|nr:amino acid ABC transporter substrate-binding protein [Lachnospiraceae bacterium]MCI7594824.1 amino acid ABC transporter substrate-binding protein [Lachnospiraceae bacterium]MDD7050998.1 amino acid ABC transporter substrate-binding protein [Lachnospiraceae bacterium]MDY3224213.1 amino acid ABC transporter substrate-binding protein [Lachnospiraceae bacterium]MDY4097430.1 amino acid ABC transporter substrate-binding protein [Lachnospiraceae bacterium]